jgi:hypothetical protein
MFVCHECCVVSGRGLWDELITRPEESYPFWYVQLAWLGSPVRGGGHVPESRVEVPQKKCK